MKPDYPNHCIAQKFCTTLEQLEKFSKEIVTLIKPNEKVMLCGKMGSGKTTLVRYLLQAMNYDGIVSSPTFTLAHEYHVSSGTVFHIDLYRLGEGDENIGLAEIFDSEAMVFVEWGERIDWIGQRASLFIDINFSGEGREIKVFSWDKS